MDPILKLTEHQSLIFEDMVVHLIKTGFRDERYLVVYEDPYELLIGNTEVMTRDDIEETFNVLL